MSRVKKGRAVGEPCVNNVTAPLRRYRHIECVSQLRKSFGEAAFGGGAGSRGIVGIQPFPVAKAPLDGVSRITATGLLRVPRLEKLPELSWNGYKRPDFPPRHLGQLDDKKKCVINTRK